MMASVAKKETVKSFSKMNSVLETATKSLKRFESTIQRINDSTSKMPLTKSFAVPENKIETAKTEFNTITSEIAKSANEQESLNNKIRAGKKEAMGFKDIYDMLGGFETVKDIANTLNEMTQSNVRLELIVDDGGSVEELRNKIFSSAQDSRAAYTDMVSSVTELGLSAGDSFNSTDEIIKFTEIAQKMGTISGLSPPEVSGVNDQINQAMSSGGLQDGDYEGILKNTPILGQAVADYMGVGIDELEKLASQGEITSDIIKSAMFSISDEVDKRFEKMPITLGQIWNSAINNILMCAQPLVEFINLLAKNWSMLEPIILGAAAAWGVYTIAVNNVKIVEIAQDVWTGITTAAKAVATTITWMFTRATLKQAAAQHSLNTALLACPLAWIIIIIIAIITVFYLVIAAINKFAGTALSATGIIAGAFAAVAAFIFNLVIEVINRIVGAVIQLYNLFAIIANFFATLFNDPVAAIIDLFVGLFDVILGVVQSAAELIDAVIGTNMSDKVKDFRNYVAESADDIIGENKVEVVKKLDSRDYQMKYFDLGNAWNTGYKFGEGLFKDKDKDKPSSAASIAAMTGANKVLDSNKNLNTDDLGNVLDNQEYDVNIKDEVKLADESLEYLLDDVTQKYINNINLQAPAPNVSVKIDVENGSDLDLDAIAEKTKQKLGVEIVEFAMSSTDIRH
jgi:tape measure domain-containing protein